MSQKIQHRRGLKKGLPNLEVAEIGITTDTKELYFGTDEGNQRVPKMEDVPSIKGLETISGAQEKADAAESNAKAYAERQIALIPDVDVSSLSTKQELQTHDAKSATTGVKGHVQLSSAINSTSTTLAATPSAVKQAYDRAEAAFRQADDGKTAVANAVTAKGVPASPSDTFTALATKIGQILTGKNWGSGTHRIISNTYVDLSILDFEPSYFIAYQTGRGANTSGTTDFTLIAIKELRRSVKVYKSGGLDHAQFENISNFNNIAISGAGHIQGLDLTWIAFG